jgi:hypothetical protein
VNNVITTESDGTLNVYLHSGGGADPRNPASFGSGKLVASYTVHPQNIITVIGPNRGIATASGQLVQKQAQSFDVPGAKGKRFGRSGFVSRLSLNGAGTRSQPTLPRASLAIAGNAVAASG